jgi:hypothetical protein
LADAVRHVGTPYLEVLVHVTEAAFAWCHGERATAHRLATYAADTAERLHMGRAEPIARMLAGATGEPLIDLDAERCLAEAERCEDRGTAVAMLGVLALASRTDRRLLRQRADHWAQGLRDDQLNAVRDVISAREAIDLLRATPDPR